MFGNANDKENQELTSEQLIAAVVEHAQKLVDKRTLRSAEMKDGVGYLDYWFCRAEYRAKDGKLEVLYKFDTNPPMKKAEADDALEGIPDLDKWNVLDKEDADPEVVIGLECPVNQITLDNITAGLREETPRINAFRDNCNNLGYELA